MSGHTARIVRAGADGVVKKITPVTSRTPGEARLGVLKAYKTLQRITPDFWFNYDMQTIPLPVFRDILKKKFTDNAHLTDIRIIDRKVYECYKDIEAIQWAWYNPDHVRNMLFRENIDPKSTDFLSRFLAGN